MRAVKFSLIVPLFALGCAPTALDEAIAETGIEGPFGEVPDEGKFDGSAARGPSIREGASTEVWAATRAWAELDPAAGLAWSAESGLNWEQKFSAWVASFETEARHGGTGETFIITTPYGERRFHAPTLECAEVALFLRATFASWYHLPFFVQGWDSASRQTFYAGHFGFVTRSGERLGRFPSFRTSYRDYEDGWEPGDAWPTDARLRRYRLGDDDGMNFLTGDGSEAGAGTYFDELFLNKRTGYFMRLLLLYFGSTNLADGANMFHIAPEATSAGDVLIHRWQRRGTGHVMPIFQVTRHGDEALEIAVASGSMPRREPVWEEPRRARSRFTSDNGGGVGTARDGNAFAALGGGVRRWRQAVLSGGRWRNEVPTESREAFINDAALDEIAARPARFGEILRSLSPEERRRVALDGIEAARNHLRQYPASCSARIRREDAFEALYAVEAEAGRDRASVDATYRTLEDRVFATLVYESSRTCCWNRSTAAMHDIVMHYAEREQADAEAEGMCVEPTVFRAELDGYDRWADFADTLGRGAEWASWSEDETCAQRDVPEDSVDATREVTAHCASTMPAPEPEPEPEPGPEPEPEPTPGANGCDAVGGSSQSAATNLNYNHETAARVCGDEDDWFRVEATGERTVVVRFEHAVGDLDLEVVSADGALLGSSAGVSDEERVTAEGPFWVRVYGYAGAANDYTIVVR